MTRAPKAHHAHAIVALALLAALGFAACTDPVRDEQIDLLGGEEPDVPPGPDHRPGQPCVLCHSEGGPASDTPFVVGGTVYATPAPGAPGQADIFVGLVDANGSSPRQTPLTNGSGNFFVRKTEWPDLAFPLRVALYRDIDKPPDVEMKSLIGRDGSCNYCHQPTRSDKLEGDDAYLERAVVPQISFAPAGAP